VNHVILGAHSDRARRKSLRAQQRARRRAQLHRPLEAIKRPVPHVETAAEAIAALDTQFAWPPPGAQKLILLVSSLEREPWFEYTLGSQTFCGELSLPIIQRRIPAGRAQPPSLVAVGDDLAVSAAGLLRNTSLQTTGLRTRAARRLRFAFLTSPLVHD
jgi:hypothetical protein